ncbi:unnamed protein product, partial [marine sediment metagenome]
MWYISRIMTKTRSKVYISERHRELLDRILVP